MNYNTPEGTTWFNGLSQADMATFASDLSANWMNAWTSRFTIAPQFLSGISAVKPSQRTALINALNNMATANLSMTTLDVGMRIVLAQSGNPSQQQVSHYEVHIDMGWVGIVYCVLSCWIEHKVYA